MEQNNSIDKLEIYQSKILILDDEEMNVSILSDLLENEGYINITGETDSYRAIELYKINDYDLLLLDINMPELDGFGVLTALETIDKTFTPPVLILTALHDQHICNRALESGATDFVNKPFDEQEALNRIRNLLTTHIIRKRLSYLNINLEKMVKDRTQQLLETKLKVIQHLGYAAEYRDTETAAHTIRVGEYSRLLANKLGLEEKIVELLYYAAPLHDIGKIGIPDAILLKPGKFEPKEWEIMKTHTTIGAEILEQDDDPLIVMARSIAMTHHEKYDGTGYPNGLSAEEIPIEGRIVMLADVYDALTMVRPYKKAWSIKETTDYITSQSGQLFDPKLIDLFLEYSDEFKAIRKKFID